MLIPLFFVQVKQFTNIFEVNYMCFFTRNQTFNNNNNRLKVEALEKIAYFLLWL